MDNVPRAPTENPDDSGLGHNMDLEPPPFWDTYDAINQIYLELGEFRTFLNHLHVFWLHVCDFLRLPSVFVTHAPKQIHFRA